MITDKHTPGDWDHHQGRKKHEEARFIVAVQPDGTRVFVAKVYGHAGQPCLANAKLIAAASKTLEQRNQLLEAIDDLLSLIITYPDHLNLCPCCARGYMVGEASCTREDCPGVVARDIIKTIERDAKP